MYLEGWELDKLAASRVISTLEGILGKVMTLLTLSNLEQLPAKSPEPPSRELLNPKPWGLGPRCLVES